MDRDGDHGQEAKRHATKEERRSGHGLRVDKEGEDGAEDQRGADSEREGCGALKKRTGLAPVVGQVQASDRDFQ